MEQEKKSNIKDIIKRIIEIIVIILMLVIIGKSFIREKYIRPINEFTNSYEQCIKKINENYGTISGSKVKELFETIKLNNEENKGTDKVIKINGIVPANIKNIRRKK